MLTGELHAPNQCHVSLTSFGFSLEPQNVSHIRNRPVVITFCMPSQTRATDWCFTLNDAAEEETTSPERLELVLGARYLVCQRERGMGGTLHYQGASRKWLYDRLGYVEFADRKTLLGVRRLLPRAHWEPRCGTRTQARDYSCKDETRCDGPWEFGDWIDEPTTGRGRRNDLLSLKSAIDQGADDAVLWQTHFPIMWRGSKAANTYRLAKGMSRPNAAPLALVYWGFTGTGKSRRVRELAGEDAYWVSNPGRGQPVWFDGYVGQRAIVFDDFYGWMPWSNLLRLLDRNPLNLNCKGTTAPLLATEFYFTSNSHPSMWYPKQPYETLERRISVMECASLMPEYC